jgi:hypothetical protein
MGSDPEVARESNRENRLLLLLLQLGFIMIGINGVADQTQHSGIGDPEGDGQEVRRFSTRQGCLVEKS